jgi:hypothetical protein
MICLYWYIYICPLFYLHYLDISPLVFFIRLSHNLPVYFVLLCNCSVLYVVSVVSVKNERNKPPKNNNKKRVPRTNALLHLTLARYIQSGFISFLFFCVKLKKALIDYFMDVYWKDILCSARGKLLDESIKVII